MKKITLLKQNSLSVLAFVGLQSIALAQESIEPTVFDDEDDVIVVTASRLPESVVDVRGVVTTYDGDEIFKRQQIRVQDAIKLAPGVISTSTAGQDGQTATLIVRGLATKYNQFLIDGVRVTDGFGTSSQFGNILGNYALGYGEQLDLVNGGGSVVHGNSSYSGVFGIYNTFEDIDPTLTLFQESGSFEYSNTQISSKGAVDGVRYYLEGGSQEYENDLPKTSSSRYEISNQQFSFGVETDLGESDKIAVTTRIQESDIVNASPVHISVDTQVASVKWSHSSDRLEIDSTLGYYDEYYNYASTGFNSKILFEKFSFTTDIRQEFEHLSLNYGLDFSWNDYIDTGNGRDFSYNVLAAYVGGEKEFGALTTGVSARAEQNSKYDVLPSINSYLNYDSNMGALFARVVRSERAPSLLESEAYPAFGFNAAQLANPNLAPEQITSVELGGSKEVSGQELTATLYSHFITDTISKVGNQFQNAGGTSEVNGLEVSLNGRFLDDFIYTIAWNNTHTNENKNTPRNTVNADLRYEGDRWTVGTGVSHASKANYGGNKNLDSHVITRLYGSVEVTDYLTLSARLENLFNEEYEINPFGTTQGKGASAYVGATLNW